MELITGGNVLHISAKAMESFSGEILIVKKEERGHLDQIKPLDRDSPFRKLNDLGHFQKK